MPCGVHVTALTFVLRRFVTFCAQVVVLGASSPLAEGMPAAAMEASQHLVQLLHQPKHYASPSPMPRGGSINSSGELLAQSPTASNGFQSRNVMVKQVQYNQSVPQLSQVQWVTVPVCKVNYYYDSSLESFAYQSAFGDSPQTPGPSSPAVLEPQVRRIGRKRSSLSTLERLLRQPSAHLPSQCQAAEKVQNYPTDEDIDVTSTSAPVLGEMAPLSSLCSVAAAASPAPLSPTPPTDCMLTSESSDDKCAS